MQFLGKIGFFLKPHALIFDSWYSVMNTMAVEVELKTRIDDIEPLKERLFAIGHYNRSYQKVDTYWVSRQSFGPAVRVRREKGVKADSMAYEFVLATVKTKTISDGIEVNDEREFSVSDGVFFEELLQSLGMFKALSKEKNGWAWDIHQGAALQPVDAELSLVTGLGWFLELEIICPDGETQVIEESRKRLLALLAELEIPSSWIEERPYTVMLQGLA